MMDSSTAAHRAHFSVLGEGRVFLNAAYMTPKPDAALEAMQRAVSRMGSPDFGAQDFFDPPESVRAALSRLVGGEPTQYSLTGAVSFGVSTLAWNLRDRPEELVGDRRTILGVEGQFPSNVQAWRRLEDSGFSLELIPAGPEASRALVNRLDANVALVAVEPLSWTDGVRLELDPLLAAAREAGALTLVDVTQSAGVDPPLEGALDADIVVGAGYKWLFGPYGTGFMRLTPDLQRRLEPLEASWKNFEGARDFNRLTEYGREPFSDAARFDHGQSSAFVRLAGWLAGLEFLQDLGLEAIRAHTRAFAEGVRAGLDEARYVVGQPGSAGEAAHLFRVAPRDPADFSAKSAALAEAGLFISQRDGGWRLSPHVYNGQRDLARTLEAFA